MSEPQVDATARSATSLPLDRFWSERGLSNLAALALTVLALVLCFLIVQPFVSSLAWATALAVVAWPLHRRVARRVPWPSAAAALSVVAIALLLVVPSGMLIPGVIDEALRSSPTPGTRRSTETSGSGPCGSGCASGST
jgi:hypothetical protein